jgi:hypothetical protein
MQAEERIKELIVAKYGNVRAFATESGISYTTVRSILERGVMNAKAENVFKMCRLLGISPDTLADWKLEDSLTKTSHDIDEAIKNAVMYNGNTLTEEDKRAIRGIVAGYMSSKER